MTSPVRKTSVAVDKMAEDWGLVDAVMGGTKAMRAAGKSYLPQWTSEDPDSYKTRLATATFFPAYARTISVLTGKPFSKELTYGADIPTGIKELLDDVDLQGRNLHAFAADLAAEAMAYGLCGILVDCPPNPGAKTLADEQKAGIRPYFVHVHHNAILGWKTEKSGGALRLSQLRLLESVEEQDGDFGTKIIPQVRVLEPGKWSTWRKTKPEDDDSWAGHEEGVTTLNVIPFIPVYGRRDDLMIGCAPMIELAHAKVEHWQSKSDQQTILHVARVPILFTKDIGDAVITVGGGSFIKASSKDADVKYVEHSGAAIEAGRVSLHDLEDRMRQTGAELLVIKPGHATQVQVMAENEQGMCDLQRIVEGMEDSLDQGLDLMAQWMRQAKGGHVTIYKDFGAATLAEASATLLFEMQSAGSLSFETLLSELKRRGILSPDVMIAAEIERAKKEAAERPPVVVQENVRP
jgi:hypothetical protein